MTGAQHGRGQVDFPGVTFADKAFVNNALPTFNRPTRYEIPQYLCGLFATRVIGPGGILADLVRLRRVDMRELNLDAINNERIAINDARLSGGSRAPCVLCIKAQPIKQNADRKQHCDAYEDPLRADPDTPQTNHVSLPVGTVSHPSALKPSNVSIIPEHMAGRKPS